MFYQKPPFSEVLPLHLRKRRSKYQPPSSEVLHFRGHHFRGFTVYLTKRKSKFCVHVRYQFSEFQSKRDTVKPRKWWPQKWRTSLDGGWYLDLLFLKWRGKTSENGGFFLGKLSNQYYYIIRVYNKLQVRSERTLRL